MRWILAFAMASGVFALATPSARTSLAASIEPYLTDYVPEQGRRRLSVLLPAGGSAAAAGGAFAGLLAAQGDLFLAGRSRSALALAVLGAGGGWFLWSMRNTNKAERKARRLRFELPVIADAMSLHIVAGESITSTIRSVSVETSGVASDELAAIVADLDGGVALPEALRKASGMTAHEDAVRLFETLSHAHTTGGRLASALGDLAVDYRSALARDLTTESGKRAVTSYGPVLALMIPTSLLFLLYPTLLGLRALSGAP